MVFLLVFLTVAVFLGVDYILRREDRELKEIGKQKKSPIFLSPEKSLMPVGATDDRLFHQSHSWVEPLPDGEMYIGFDNFISTLFSENVNMEDLPLVGSHVPQGTKIWDVGIGKHKIAQLSPVSGKVVDINPACKLNVPISSGQTEKSWVIKIMADNLAQEENNLMQVSQAAIVNNAMTDEFFMSAQKGHYLNDGGKIDPGFIEKMSGEDWSELMKKFFPYQTKIH